MITHLFALGPPAAASNGGRSFNQPVMFIRLAWKQA
jgi:hypothetical protein